MSVNLKEIFDNKLYMKCEKYSDEINKVISRGEGKVSHRRMYDITIQECYDVFNKTLPNNFYFKKNDEKGNETIYGKPYSNIELKHSLFKEYYIDKPRFDNISYDIKNNKIYFELDDF